MTDTPAPKKPRTKKAPANQAVQAFQPIVAPEGAKAILSPENQIRFHTMLSGMTDDERRGAVLVLNAIAANPLLEDGYRRFFRFWRQYGPNLNIGNVRL